MDSPFRGLVAAPFTPFHEDYTLNPEVIPAYARLLEANEVTAAFICGTTGEGPSLTVEERLEVAERWMACASEKLRIIVHVGGTCLPDAQRLAEQAAHLGAAAIGCFAPYFFRPGDVHDLANWCEAVAAAGTPIPFYYYHIPAMTGLKLPVREFLEEAAGRIPTLRGVKYTYEDLEDYEACTKVDGGRFDCLFGRDELLLEALERGALGAVGSTYNFAAPLYHQIIAHHQAGNEAEARRLQSIAVKMIEVCGPPGVNRLAVFKRFMAELGLDCGPVRLPLRQPTDGQYRAIREELSRLGFIEFASASL